MKKSAIRVVILVPPNAQSLDISGPLDVFQEANLQSDEKVGYDVRLISIDGSKFIKIGGMKISSDGSIKDPDFPIDTLLVAGTPDYHLAMKMKNFNKWLNRRISGIRRYGSVCTGAFFLGAAGLLEGKKVTTHWENASELAENYPNAKVIPDSIYIQDGALYTSAGVTAGIDLALKFVEDDYGRELALKIARRLVVFLRRPGGQSQFSAHLAAQIASESHIQEIQNWILKNISTDLSLSVLASKTAMSVRNFSRVFKKETGATPMDFVELARVDAARRMLEESNIPLKQVAKKCGFTNVDLMRRSFVRRISIGPKDYRMRFQQ